MAATAQTRMSAANMDNDHEQPRPGRPRSDKARQKILEATRRLLAHNSLQALSIEAIAKKAGVGKTTIYRWWPSKAAVAMDAFLEQGGIQMIAPTTNSASESIRDQLERLIRQLRGHNGRIIAGIIAEAQADGEVSDLLYEKFLKDRIEPLWHALENGKANGEFRAALDSEIALDMLLGPLFLRVLSGEHGIDRNFAENYPDQALLALS